MIYNIFSYNYETGEQKTCSHAAYLDVASDICESFALNYVLEREGLKYLQKKIWHRKTNLPNGYSIVKNTKKNMSKYTIYLKERDGYLVAGNKKKVMCFFTFKVIAPQLPPRISEMTEYYKDIFNTCLYILPANCNLRVSEMSEDSKEKFEEVLKEIPYIVEKILLD